jgi:hypothetical protein
LKLFSVVDIGTIVPETGRYMVSPNPIVFDADANFGVYISRVAGIIFFKEAPHHVGLRSFQIC